MQKSTQQKPQIKLIGITAQTSNKAELDPTTAKIGLTMSKYFLVFESIPHRSNPGVTFCAYTQYETDYKGGYTYFIGEEVDSFDDLPAGLETLTIPSQTYAKFTTNPGTMPLVVIDAWQKIWQMDSSDFGGNRGYLTDFELYDERALNPLVAVVDIYIGVTK
jgi:predicted transcriptional regulator YdeE